MGVLVSIIKVIILVAVSYYLIKIVHALITQPNLRVYLTATMKDLKNMYYRYHV
jgi:hypothetical protein